MFVDAVTIEVEAGRGGDGCLSFRREKYIPRGGPDGGDGGDGGSVIFVATAGVDSLASLSGRNHWKAQNGERGGSSNCHGRNAQDLVIPLPPGTLMIDADQGHVIKDLADRWRDRGGGPRRAWRQGQHALQERDEPRPAANDSRRRARNAAAHARAQGDCRRGPGRQAERRQEHAAQPSFARSARNRRLSVHDEVPEPGHRAGGARSLVRAGRHSRA